MIYSSWDKERDRLKLVILGNFLSFYPPKTLQKYNFEKLRNTAGDIILLHLCTKNYNRIISGSLVRSDTERIFLSFSAIFLLLPHNDPKNQIFEKKKKLPEDIILLHMCTINVDHMIYGSWNIRCNR